MAKASRDFQVFAKPAGPLCNLDCAYCYYLKKDQLYPKGESFCMPEIILEEYIVQHIEASTEPVIRFSWHGGEPTILGLEYFHKVVNLQRKHQPPNQRIMNGMQTNGTLLDDEWCRFLFEEDFSVGLSLDGPQEMHDRYRRDKGGNPTHELTMRGYKLLDHHRVSTDILCVVNAHNVRYPLEVYRFFKRIGASYVSFLPMVDHQPKAKNGVSTLTVPSDAWGTFLCTIFDEWVSQDIGKIKVQIFEEAARTAFEQEHSLCIFRPICGDIPVIEHNGDFYSCDHFVDAEHKLGNIIETVLARLLESPVQRAFGKTKLDSLPRYCRECEVKAMCNGECPKNRFIRTPDGEDGLNYLCAGYKRFFSHCMPFIDEVAAEWKRQAP
ncbi:MAG: anaerobic sulfatase maturase [Candidatus Aminicenantes bacterium]|nr:MAG: anaerobic sulfatase maturase [Candidatus Aminicenantes bacterium]